MKKPIILSVFIISFIVNAKAQTYLNKIIYEKGKLCISSLPNGGISSNDFILGLNIKPGIFVINNLMFSTEIGAVLSNNEENRQIYFKPALEYYILNKKISPVIRFGYYFAEYSADKSVYASPFTGFGVNFITGKNGRIGLQIGADYMFKKNNFGSKINPYISFAFYFNRKKR